MISAKDLTEEQRSAIQQWALEGAQLADIQKRLGGQFGLNATYMDTRFLVLDLGIELQAETPAGPDPELGGGGPENDTPAAPSLLDPAEPGPAGTGRVTVTTDELTRPGAIVSGTVTFSDGEKAVWLIDQMGRPGLDPDTPGYQPSDKDLMAFEKELRKALEG